jgi:hypothetical protein
MGHFSFSTKLGTSREERGALERFLSGKGKLSWFYLTFIINF